jgi:hypothetical protein
VCPQPGPPGALMLPTRGLPLPRWAWIETPEFPVFVKYRDFTVILRGGLPQTDATVYSIAALSVQVPYPVGTVSGRVLATVSAADWEKELRCHCPF